MAEQTGKPKPSPETVEITPPPKEPSRSRLPPDFPIPPGMTEEAFLEKAARWRAGLEGPPPLKN